MVWKAKYTAETFHPGDTRIKRTFAWLPKKVADDMVWLQYYETFQWFNVKEYIVNIPGQEKPQVFKVNEWVDLSHRKLTK